MSQLCRYDHLQQVQTSLDPLQDSISWIAGLRSKGYVSDILRSKHGFTSKKEIADCSQSICKFAQYAVGLLEQAYSGPPELSFLPLYYCLLNLSKVYIVLSPNRARLATNRHHGASYPLSKASQDLMTEEITIKSSGVLPLFYETLTGSVWTKGKKYCIGDVYPYLANISYEYGQAYGKPAAVRQIMPIVRGDQTNGFQLGIALHPSPHPDANNKRFLKILQGFTLDKQTQSPLTYVTDNVFSPNIEQAKTQLANKTQRFLIWDHEFRIVGGIYSVTPISNQRILLPEEFPIWLAFFHLSNVVRYNPEFLTKLQDSKSWAMLLALRRHTILRFLILFWSYLQQTTFILSVR